MPPRSRFTAWVGTLRAAIFLAAARFMVRFVPFALLRNTLGILQDGDLPSVTTPTMACNDTDLALAVAGRVERAAMRLPGESRCLPMAIALYWLLHGRGIDAQLVIAVHRSDRVGTHAYHAWVEHCGAMLIGICERSDYRKLMAFTYRSQAAADQN